MACDASLKPLRPGGPQASLRGGWESQARPRILGSCPDRGREFPWFERLIKRKSAGRKQRTIFDVVADDIMGGPARGWPPETGPSFSEAGSTRLRTLEHR